MASPNTKRDNSLQDSDLYITPLEALEAADKEGLFDRFNVYFDPCNGLGDIADFLRAKGKKVYTSDKYDYGCQDYVADFLTYEKVPADVECIIFNPPFKLSEEFIDKALSLHPNLLMFNRATILETASRSRKHKTKEWKLKKFWSFGYRVSCNKGTDREPTANAVWYGISEYDQNYTGEPTIDWFIR